MATKRPESDKHMGVAEVKRRFADVIGEVMHLRRRIIIERRGRPVAAIVPLEEAVDQLAPGEPTVAAAPLSEETFAEFERVMKHVLASRQNKEYGQVSEPEE